MNTQPVLPWQGRSPQARHASYSGAVVASERKTIKQRAYVALLTTHGPLSDQDVAAKLTWALSSVNSIRHSLGDQIVAVGCQASPVRRVKRTVWAVRG